LTSVIAYVKVITAIQEGTAMYEKEKQAVIKTALTIKEYGLVALAGGNVSMRLPNGDILVTP